MTFNNRIPEYIKQVESSLDTWLPSAEQNPATLHQAMRYAVLNGGKRIRPLLTYAAGEVLGVDSKKLNGIACAVEMIHAYSLVHDDLPAMDDDDLRRGKPTVHKEYDEAMAILVGDALQALAFKIIAEDPQLPDSDVRIQCIKLLADAAGSYGMVGGQVLDIASEDKVISEAELTTIHELKTGQLIRTSVVLPCYSANGIDAAGLKHFDRFGQCLGLAFQIRDDILDVEASTETLGKQQGADQALNKATFPALLGMDQAKQRAEELYQEALDMLSPYAEQAEPLRWLAGYIVQRDH